MNAGETAKYLAWLKVTLPVMEAFAKGETIQFKSALPYEMEWCDCDSPYWCKETIYRIKPKPMERWGLVDADGCTEGTMYRTPERAKQLAKKWGLRVVHMREVMEE